jgi:hypothetical protein
MRWGNGVICTSGLALVAVFVLYCYKEVEPYMVKSWLDCYRDPSTALILFIFLSVRMRSFMYHKHNTIAKANSMYGTKA